MKHEFIPYEEALELKELGYRDYESLALYCKGVLYQLYPNMHEDIPDNVYREVDAPLYQQAFRWFRKKYRLEQMITFNHVTQEYAVMIMYRSSTKYDGIVSSDWISPIRNYEEAELACLKKLIEIVK